MTARDADADRACGVGRRDVLRRVADDESALRVEPRADDRTGTVDRFASQLAAVGGVGAVAAEEEETVQICARELDVGRGLDCSSRDPEQEAAMAQAGK